MIAIILISTMNYGCGNGKSHEQPEGNQDSVVAVEQTGESLDWSTVAPEDLWAGVTEVYQTEGPALALILIEQGIQNGVVTELEANQVRAGYLYECGRLDEAFLALASYKIENDRPDLLRLRAEVLWSMGRFTEAERDYEAVLDVLGENVDTMVIYQLARLYELTGNWEKLNHAEDKLDENPDDPVAKQYNLIQALKSENVEAIRAAGMNIMDEGVDMNPMATFAAAYGAFLEGSYESAIGIIDDYTNLYGDDLNITSLKLRIHAENNDFEAFETDLRKSFENQGTLNWLDSPIETKPRFPDYRNPTAGLLDFASALELGRGDPLKAELMAGRALELNPYDPIAHLQQAAVDLSIDDIESCFGKLNDALSFAAPTDLRTRLRMLQFQSMAGENVEIPWDSNEILDQMTSTVAEFRDRYPENAWYVSVAAEVNGYSGNINRAIDLYESARELPGAAREMAYRHAYWVARSGNVGEAFRIFSTSIPEKSPDLTWAVTLHTEAKVTGDAKLSEFADLVINHLDPSHEHAELFY